MGAQDGLHLVFQHKLVQLDAFLLGLVVLREEGLLLDVLEPPLVFLVLFVQAAELAIRLDQLLFQLVAVGHGNGLLDCRNCGDV